MRGLGRTTHIHTYIYTLTHIFAHAYTHAFAYRRPLLVCGASSRTGAGAEPKPVAGE